MERTDAIFAAYLIDELTLAARGEYRTADPNVTDCVRLEGILEAVRVVCDYQRVALGAKQGTHTRASALTLVHEIGASHDCADLIAQAIERASRRLARSPN
jgi:hypothetical protein